MISVSFPMRYYMPPFADISWQQYVRCHKYFRPDQGCWHRVVNLQRASASQWAVSAEQPRTALTSADSILTSEVMAEAHWKGRAERERLHYCSPCCTGSMEMAQNPFYFESYQLDTYHEQTCIILTLSVNHLSLLLLLQLCPEIPTKIRAPLCCTNTLRDGACPE